MNKPLRIVISCLLIIVGLAIGVNGLMTLAASFTVARTEGITTLQLLMPLILLLSVALIRSGTWLLSRGDVPKRAEIERKILKDVTPVHKKG